MEALRAALTADQLEAYALEGVVRLPGAVPAADVEAMLATLWKRLESWHGHWRDKPATWTKPHPAQLAARNNDFAAMGSTCVRAIADQLLGAGQWKDPERWGLPMVTLPGHYDRWDVPCKWHLDIAATPEPPRMVRLFLILAPLEPGGGGTGYIAGSHRVIRQLARREGAPLNTGMVRKLLVAREPWYAALESRRKDEDRVTRFMSDDGRLDGVPVRVCEMTGEPGDMFLMDPLMMHATTPNAGASPRMMLMDGIYAA
ncbi:phytanoyl-CoA dioxygenase family protein [Phenylobacterium sp.]|uniref:phytanoyl-CoA dioxygenase family protein n=1 Tax=Phenylobacterium sp. TaxID=1871053 RepID=UPI0025DD3477|nr:phytanoyl-CoA dioxygenase family protein [Phenylobacterium sp.]